MSGRDDVPQNHVRRIKLLAAVHVARNQLGLDDDDYRSLLERVTGARSAANLTEAELGRVMDAFRELGWVPKPNGPRSEKPHVRKVWALWGELERAGLVRSPGRNALRAFVTRMTKVTDPEWLSPEQANIVIEAMKAWKRRGSEHER